MDAILKISLSAEIPLLEAKRMTRKIVPTFVGQCELCRFVLKASPNDSDRFYIVLSLHTSKRCGANVIIDVLNHIEKVYASHGIRLDPGTSSSILTMSVTVEDNYDNTFRSYQLSTGYRCTVMAQLNKKYACPYVLERQNATDVYAAKGVVLKDIADNVTSANDSPMYRICLSDITVRNAATQASNLLPWATALMLLMLLIRTYI